MQDADIRKLIDSYRELAGLAAECPNVQEIPGTTDVSLGIFRLGLDIASLVDAYARGNLVGTRR